MNEQTSVLHLGDKNYYLSDRVIQTMQPSVPPNDIQRNYDDLCKWYYAVLERCKAARNMLRERPTVASIESWIGELQGNLVYVNGLLYNIDKSKIELRKILDEEIAIGKTPEDEYEATYSRDARKTLRQILPALTIAQKQATRGRRQLTDIVVVLEKKLRTK